MSITRRSVLQGALVTAAAVSVGATRELAVSPAALLVYDSRLLQSCSLWHRHAGPSIDLAAEHANLWRRLRSLRPGVPVVGLTSWSDYVQVRTLLGERHMRLRAEARRGRLFYWEIA